MKKQLLIIIICLFSFINEAFSQVENDFKIDNKITCPSCKGIKKCTSCFQNRGLCLVCDGLKKHNGECPNCKNWNESYRYQVPCHRCKNTREVVLPGCEYCKSTGKCQYCKGSKICETCKGRGYFDPYVNLKESNLVKLPKPNDCEIEIKHVKGPLHPELLNTYVFAEAQYPSLKYDKKENILFSNNNRIAIKIGSNFYSLPNDSIYSTPTDLDLYYNFDEINVVNARILFHYIPNGRNNETLWLIYNDKKTGCDIVADALLIDPNTKKMFIDAVDSRTNNSNSGQVKVVKNIFIFPDVKDNQPGYVSPEENIVDCKDFPFQLGCVNDIIGDINEKFFGRGHRRANVFTKELLRALVSSALIDTDDKDPKITQEIYDIILKNSKKNVIKE